MKRLLHIERILIYYDYPQLFLAKDNLQLDYLCLLTSSLESEYSYHCVSISKARLHQFLLGKEDLRDIFVNPELKEWWETRDTSNLDFEISLYSTSGLDDMLLPDAECFYSDQVEDESIREDVVEHDNVVIHLSLSDEYNHLSIPADDLGDFAKLYQALIENAYKKAIMNSAIEDKRSFVVPNNYKLNAFAASPGSFVLHLASNSSRDLFGSSYIEYGLRRIDDIILESDNEEELIQSLKQIKGHTVSNYRRLLEKIVSKNVTFQYKWLSPASQIIHTRKIDKTYAQKIKDILDLKTELVEEMVELVGFVKQADVERGSWRITNEEDNRDYSGESEGHRLDGITLETKRYKFICEEILEAMRVTEREKVKYILKSIEEL